MKFAKVAIETGNPDAPWAAVLNTERGLRMMGYETGTPVRVTVIDQQEPGCYYAWLESTGRLTFVRPQSSEILAILAPTKNLGDSRGHIVRVRIERAIV